MDNKNALNDLDPLMVSLVIPTHNRAESLARTLSGIKALSVPRNVTLQIVVVLDGCTDNSKDIAKSWANDAPYTVTTISTEGLGAGGARNAGIAASKGSLIGFLDDDVLPSSDWLLQHLALHNEFNAANALSSSIGLVSIGTMTLPTDQRLPAWNEWEVLSLNERYRQLTEDPNAAGASDLYTANAMMPKYALDAVGGFDASLKRAEDVELAKRLAEYGLNFTFVPDAGVVHYPIRTLSNWKNIPVNYAHSHISMGLDVLGSDSKGLIETTEEAQAISTPQLNRMHPLTRWAVAFFSKNKLSSFLYCEAAQLVGRIAHHLGVRSISYAAFSSVYNVLYFGTLHRAKTAQKLQ